MMSIAGAPNAQTIGAPNSLFAFHGRFHLVLGFLDSIGLAG